MQSILMVSSHLARGGTETFIMNTFRHLDRKNFRCDFLVFTDDTEGYYEEVVAAGARLFRLPPRRAGLRAYIRALNRFFADHAGEWDAVHYNGSTLTSIEPLVAAKRYGVPIRIFHSHSSKSGRGFHNRLLHILNSRRIGGVATHFLACSDVAARFAFCHVPAYRRVVIPNGIDLEAFRFSRQRREAARGTLGIAPGALTVACIGRLSVEKNPLFMVPVMRELLAMRPDARLFMVGEGQLREQMQRSLEEAGIAGAVTFTGIRKDIPELMSAFDVLAMPSVYEGLPFVAIEAQGAHLPVVISANVTPGIAITPLVRRLSLSDGSEVWARTIAESVVRDRESRRHDGRIADYGISATVAKLQDIYAGR